jgi:hypothetical protein
MKVKDQRAQVVELSGRQRGMENRHMKVFDHRNSSYLCDMEYIDPKNKDRLVFLSFLYGEGENIPFINRPKSYIVSAYVPEGHFYYSCCGSRETDPQYVGIITDKHGIENTITRLSSIGRGIIWGREIDVGELAKVLAHLRGEKAERRVANFMKLTPEEKQRELRKIFEKDGGEK